MRIILSKSDIVLFIALLLTSDVPQRFPPIPGGILTVGGILIPGGILTPATSAPLPLSTSGLSTSTRPFCSANAGVTHTPQLHFNPFQFQRPTSASHLLFGHRSLPSSSPVSRAGRIHDSGWMKRCPQAVVESDNAPASGLGSGRDDMSTAASMDLAGLGVWGTR